LREKLDGATRQTDEGRKLTSLTCHPSGGVLSRKRER
jgi:hypothetical protein